MPGDSDSGNMLLSGLSPADLEAILPYFEDFPLNRREELHRPGEPIRRAFFVDTGVISVLTVMEDGNSAESAAVGREGFVGVPLLLGADRALGRYVVQGEGHAQVIGRHEFHAALERVPAFREICNGYTAALLETMAQTTACNRLHPVDERCARWLLMMHDRMANDEFMLTQEFLAEMLGVRRPSVTVAAGMLQRAGLISYRRGKIHILDRAALEASSCECYRVIKERFNGGGPAK